MASKAVLVESLGTFPVSKDSGAEFLRQLFLACPSIQNNYDAEDMDPDSVCRSQKLCMEGAQQLGGVYGLAKVYGDPNYKFSASGFAESYKEKNLTLTQFQAYLPALEQAMATKTPMTDAQKTEWTKFFADVAVTLKDLGIPE